MKKHLVVLTGAGLSAESGLQTFRDSNGLWMGYDIYEVASPQGWSKNPQVVLDFYNMRRREVAKAKPNEAHLAIAALQEQYKVTVITQNVDDLHERAGSANVLHLHGEIFKMRSEFHDGISTDNISPIHTDIAHGDLAADGGQLRPHIVWFGEAVPMIEKAIEIVATADLFLLAGTSLQVYPAAGLIEYVPAQIPKFIIDNNPPPLPAHNNFYVIHDVATKGVKVFQEKILEMDQ